LSNAAKKIAEEIREQGAITFARFMELALYCPNCGYYEKEEDIIGGRGDYYTSVSVASLFGELLAYQFADWLEGCQPSRPRRGGWGMAREVIRIVEAGAHGGRLAGDILTWIMQNRPALSGQLQYWILEPSDRRRAWQRQNLAAFGDRVRWATNFAELAGVVNRPKGLRTPEGIRGVIFSNELLDAMPIHRLSWDAKTRMWFEWGVKLQSGGFVWTRMLGEDVRSENPASHATSLTARLGSAIENELLKTLSDGFTVEVCPAAEHWWREAANALGCGKLLAIDYGLTAEEFFVPARKDGTLRAYHRHGLNSDVLACPGAQDITAHVNFTAIQAAGEAAGLKTDAFLTQAQFLTGIAARVWKAGDAPEEWSSERSRQFQTLTHPEHLGRSFRVLVQSRM